MGKQALTMMANGGLRSDSAAFLGDYLSRDSASVADLFELRADANRSRPALVYVGCDAFPEQHLTFAALDAAANRVAHWALAVQGLRKGDTVALYMQNRCEYVVVWLGLCKAGIKTAFINTSIKQEPLLHSLKVSTSKALIFGVELAEPVRAVHERLKAELGVESLCMGGDPGFARSIDADVAAQPAARLDAGFRAGIKFTDVFGYVFTSGTTGLPKAVRVTHLKQCAFALGYHKLVSNTDVVYSSGMPLYHSSACGIGFGMVMHYGACQVLRKGFSASEWLSDVRKHKATVAQYIGELARYVTAQPARADDAANPLRLAMGNGLAPDVWESFQRRFGIAVIREFYGSTEGNGAFRNDVLLSDLEAGRTDGVGCVGRLLPTNQNGARFVRYDVDEDELVRDAASGGLVDCEPGEPGECIIPVRASSALSSFVGYTNAEATKKKLVEDGGVTFARTGDLMLCTADKWVRFVDRIGDTFRHKGENVSTQEVAKELNRFPAVLESNVYGVQVPRQEGRAGMAALVFRDARLASASPDPEAKRELAAALEGLLAHARDSLMSQAVPVFLRVQRATLTTQTFKHQKVQLRKDGCDPAKVGDDALFVLRDGGYQPFSAGDFQALQAPPAPKARL